MSLPSSNLLQKVLQRPLMTQIPTFSVHREQQLLRGSDAGNLLILKNGRGFRIGNTAGGESAVLVF